MFKCKKKSIFVAALIGVIFLSCTKEKSIQKHKLTNRKFQGIPSLAISAEGRLWATWYAGKTPSEDENNYVVVSTSGDDDIFWIEKLIIDPDGEGPVRAFDPELWMDPDGTLWLFWAETIDHDGAKAGLYAKTNNNPGMEDSKWSESRRITDGVMMCKPTVLSTGEWVLPVSTWRGTDNSARVVVSTDKGKTFTLRGACNVPREIQNYDEHMIVERKDKSLWMLIRTSFGIGESVSKDRGETWSVLEPSSIKHTTSRFFIRRLYSGNLLLVKHGLINERSGRSHLTAYLSEDDGYAWLGGLLLDERSGVSYPDGQQGSDGTIHIIYDYSRTTAREILMTMFTEEDIVAGDTGSATVSLRMIVSKYSNSKKVFIHEATIKIISQLKDSEIRYTTDGTEPNQKSLLYTEPFNVNETTILRIKEFSPDGLRHLAYDAHYIKQIPIKPVSAGTNISGLSYEYFELPELINSLADLGTYEPTKEGTIKKIAFPNIIGKLPQSFALKFSGYINVPKDDVYRFSVFSNDGSRLFVADNLVVNNDGLHGAYEEEGEIALQKGRHKIKLLYFQAGGTKELKVSWGGSYFEKQEMTKEDFSNN